MVVGFLHLVLWKYAKYDQFFSGRQGKPNFSLFSHSLLVPSLDYIHFCHFHNIYDCSLLSERIRALFLQLHGRDPHLLLPLLWNAQLELYTIKHHASEAGDVLAVSIHPRRDHWLCILHHTQRSVRVAAARWVSLLRDPSLGVFFVHAALRFVHFLSAFSFQHCQWVSELVLSTPNERTRRIHYPDVLWTSKA